MVTLAQTLGNLSLVLNSVRDGGDDDERRRAAKSGADPLEALVGKADGSRTAAAPT